LSLFANNIKNIIKNIDKSIWADWRTAARRIPVISATDAARIRTDTAYCIKDYKQETANIQQEVCQAFGWTKRIPTESY